jgi:hypothetical protein
VQWTRKTDNQHGYLDQDGNHVATGHAWRPIVVTVTRRNRNIGFGWTTVTRQTPRGLEVRDISTPSIIGTVKTVLAQIDEDVNYQSLGLTYHRVQWFLKIDGAWRKVNFIDEIRYLYEPYADGYVLDSVDAMITG